MQDDFEDFEVEGIRLRSERALRSDPDLIPLSSAVAIVRKRLGCSEEEAQSFVLGCVGAGKLWGIDLANDFDDPNADPPELADPGGSGGEKLRGQFCCWPRRVGHEADWLSGQVALSQLEEQLARVTDARPNPTCPAPDAPPAKNKGGRPPKPEREQLVIAAGAWLHVNGVPDNRAELQRYLAQDRGLGIGETTIADIARKVLTAHKEALGSDSEIGN